MDCKKEYPYWTLFWNGKPYCSGCGGENIMEIEKPSGRWIMESETEKIIARLQTDIDMYRRSYQEMNVKYTSAVAEKNEMQDRAVAYIKKADDAIAQLHKAMASTQSRIADKLASIGKLSDQEIQDVLGLFPPRVG